MGDLSRKLGTLRLEPNSTNPCKTYSFYDENLFLTGNFTSEFNFVPVSIAPDLPMTCEVHVPYVLCSESITLHNIILYIILYYVCQLQ